MKTGYIYVLTNKNNGKRYIGFTTNPKQRKWGHKGRAKRNSHQFILSNAIRKHGWEAFDFQIIDQHYDAQYAKQLLEPKYIKAYNTYYKNGKGYNMTWGGEGTLGYERSTEQKEHMSRMMRGKKLSNARKVQISQATQGINNPNYGKTHSAETRLKISKGIKKAHQEGRGKRIFTEEDRKKISIRSKQIANRPENIERMRKVGKAQKGKKGHPHTEAHKQYMSEKMRGRTVERESVNKSRLNQAEYLWILMSPTYVIYETYANSTFSREFGIDPKTFPLKWANRNRKQRVSRCAWQVLDKIPFSEDKRNFYAKNLDKCWQILDAYPACRTTSDSIVEQNSATINPPPVISV